MWSSFSLIFTYRYINILISRSDKNVFVQCNLYIIFGFVLMNKICTTVENDRDSLVAEDTKEKVHTILSALTTRNLEKTIEKGRKN